MTEYSKIAGPPRDFSRAAMPDSTTSKASGGLEARRQYRGGTNLHAAARAVVENGPDGRTSRKVEASGGLSQTIGKRTVLSTDATVTREGAAARARLEHHWRRLKAEGELSGNTRGQVRGEGRVRYRLPGNWYVEGQGSTDGRDHRGMIHLGHGR